MGQKIEIQYWDQVAATYETEWYLERIGYWGDWIEKRVILNRVNPQQDDVILEAGCGTGRLTRLLARKSKKVYAIDFSPRSIEVLNQKTRQECLGRSPTSKSTPLIRKLNARFQQQE